MESPAIWLHLPLPFGRYMVGVQVFITIFLTSVQSASLLTHDPATTQHKKSNAKNTSYFRLSEFTVVNAPVTGGEVWRWKGLKEGPPVERRQNSSGNSVLWDYEFTPVVPVGHAYKSTQTLILEGRAATVQKQKTLISSNNEKTLGEKKKRRVHYSHKP